MENTQKRDFYIDTVRGLCVFSIIFIHTVFWSGMDYVPNIVRNISLFFDIPAFFFLTGCAISVNGSVNPVKQMLKLIIIFFVVFFILQLSTLSVFMPEFIRPLFLQEAKNGSFPVLVSSYWFVPVYIVSLLYSVIVIRYLNKYFLLFFIFLIPYIYLICWCYNLSFCGYEVLGCKLQQILFYFWLILFGFYLYKKETKKRLFFAIFLILISIIGVYILNIFSLNIQNYKFPVVQLPYFIISLFSIGLIMFLAKPVKENFLSKIGKNAIYFYASQGISSSIICILAKNLSCNVCVKLFVCYVCNCVIALIIGKVLCFILKKYANTVITDEQKLF